MSRIGAPELIADQRRSVAVSAENRSGCWKLWSLATSSDTTWFEGSAELSSGRWTQVEPPGDRSREDDAIAAAILQHSPDPTIVVGRDATITYANSGAAWLIGRDEDEMIGLDILDLVHPQDVGRVAEAFTATVNGGVDTGFVLIRVRHRDGEWIGLEAMGNRLVVDGLPAGLVVTCREVALRERSSRSHDEVRSRFEQAFDRAPIGMALINLDGVLVRVNQLLTEMVGRSQQDLTGRSLFELAHPDDRQRAIAHAMAVLTSDDEPSQELRFVTPDGRTAWARISASIIRDENGDAEHGLIHAEDITEQRELRDQLERAALRDPLTGLLNRAGFAARFRAGFVAGDAPRALMLIDLDGFKAVNDAHGHLVGDEVLCAVAERLRSCLRPDSVIARIGGDEFVVYLPDVHDAASAVALGDRVRESLASTHEVGGRTAVVAGSVGVALLDGDVELSDALGAADQASYTAKRAGGNSVHLSWRSAGGAPVSDPADDPLDMADSDDVSDSRFMADSREQRPHR